MSNFNKSDLNLVIRNDFYSFTKKSFNCLHPDIDFADNWHIRAIVHHLELCMCGEIKRLLITLPPRFLKSHVASVCFPAFVLGHNPSATIIGASYNKELAEDFSNKCRLLMMEPWYKEIFPDTIISSMKNSADEFYTTKHGHRIATSPGGTLTGRGGDFIVLDDINKASDYQSTTSRENTNQWFDNTLQSRLNNMKDGCIIAIQQRIHSDDSAGYILRKGGWIHLNLPAIGQEDQKIAISDEEFYHFKNDELLHEARLDLATLEQQRKNVGNYVFSAQYLQNPIPEKGNLVPIDKFKIFDKTLTRQEGDLIAFSWDTASSYGQNSDYSVGTKWLYRPNQYYLLDIIRRKLAYTELLDEVKKQALLSNANIVLIEKAGVGAALIDELQRSTRINIIPVFPTKDKETRMIPGTADIEAGKVALPEDALWKGEFIKECAEFPNGKHDDQVDSLSQFLDWARNHKDNDIVFAKLTETLDGLNQPSNSTELKTIDDVKRLFWPNK